MASSIAVPIAAEVSQALLWGASGLAQAAPSFSPGAPARLAIVGILLVVVLIALFAAALLRRGGGQRRPVETPSETPAALPDEGIQALSRFGDLGDALLVYLFRYAADGRIVAHSASTARLLGPSLDAIKRDGAAMATLVHPDDRTTFDAAYLARTGGARRPVEAQYRLRGADGAWRWIHERVRPVAPEGGAGEAAWESVALDFTARRSASERQQHLLELQRLATKVLESFLRSDDLDASIESMLSAAGETLGLSRASFASIDPETETATIEREWTRPGIASARERRQAQELDKTGWWIPNARSGHPSVYRREVPSLGLVAVARSIHEEILAMLVVPVLVHGTLRAALVLEDLAHPRRFRREEIATAQTLAFAVLRGMERKANADEKQRVEGLQRQLERSEVVSQLAGGIAHDFNNVLFAVRGQIQILRRKPLDREVLEALDRIESSFEGASNMVAGILRAYRGEVEPAVPTPIAAALEEGCRLASRLLPETVTLERDLHDLGDAHVLSTAAALHRFVLNVVLNARDALAGRVRGRVRISGRLEPAPIGTQAVLWIDDTGPGIPPTLRERALKPFFSTKGVGGTGIGMSICQRVVKEAGGRLSLEASPDLGGLRVIATMPLVEAVPPAPALPETEVTEAEDTAPAEPSDASLDGVNCALVVEDDPAVRRILSHALTSRDVEVIERSTGADAEALVNEGAVHIDLIVMDVDLPGGSGLDVARRLRARGCPTPIVFVTGGTAEFDPELAPATLLRKPFPMEALPRVAAQIVAESRGRGP